MAVGYYVIPDSQWEFVWDQSIHFWLPPYPSRIFKESCRRDFQPFRVLDEERLIVRERQIS